MSLKNEIHPPRPADHVRDSPANRLYQHAPRLISIERRQDFGEPPGSMAMVVWSRPGCFELGLPPKLAYRV